MYDALLKAFQDKLQFAPDFKKRVKLVVEDQDDDTMIIDATERPSRIEKGEGEADVTLIAALDTFRGIVEGSKDPNMMFMMRKLKIKGSMGAAMRLNSILED